MKVLLYMMSFLPLIFGIFILQNAKSAIHEAVAMMGFVCFSVLLVGGVITGAVEDLKESQKDGGS